VTEVDTAIICQGKLVGRGIMAYETTEEVGSVEHLLVDMKTAQVVGLTYKTPGLIGRKQSLDWAQLVKIGGDRIVIQTEVPEAIDSQLSAAQDITGLEVWTDGGDHLGQVIDVCFDQSTGQVQQYLFVLKAVTELEANDDWPDDPLDGLLDEQSDERLDDPLDETLNERLNARLDEALDDQAIVELFGEETAAAETEATKTEATQKVSAYIILPQAIISAGRKRIMIAEEDAQTAAPYTQPLNLSSPKTAANRGVDWRPDRLGEQLPEIPTDFNDLLQKGQSLVGQVGDRVRQTAKRLTDEPLSEREFGEAGTLPEITEQLQKKTDRVKQQMQARFEKAREKAQDQLENSGIEERLDKTLGHTSFGRSLGKQLGRFKGSQSPQTPPIEPIDVESFEVWEDD